MVTLREALENSYNLATIHLARSVGLKNIVSTAKTAGISSKLAAYPSLALGAMEVSPLELAQSYAIFPNRGVAVTPLSVTQVVSPEGKILTHRDAQVEAAFAETSIYLMNQALRGVFLRGTARSAQLEFEHEVAGKTGTTSDSRDAWFVGYTPNLVTLSWVGFGNNQSTGLTGASGALPIWEKFMNSLPDVGDSLVFHRPEGIVEATIEKSSGRLYSPSCNGSPLLEYFLEGTKPESPCS
jgi:penicillin-binding protein 1B